MLRSLRHEEVLDFATANNCDGLTAVAIKNDGAWTNILLSAAWFKQVPIACRFRALQGALKENALTSVGTMLASGLDLLLFNDMQALRESFEHKLPGCSYLVYKLLRAAHDKPSLFDDIQSALWQRLISISVKMNLPDSLDELLMVCEKLGIRLESEYLQAELIVAGNSDHAEAFLALVRYLARKQINVAFVHVHSLLLRSIERNHTNILEKSGNFFDKALSSKGGKYMTTAVRYGRVKIVQWMFTRSSDPDVESALNAAVACFERDPDMQCHLTGNTEYALIAKVLLDNGANVRLIHHKRDVLENLTGKKYLEIVHATGPLFDQRVPWPRNRRMPQTRAQRQELSVRKVAKVQLDRLPVLDLVYSFIHLASGNLQAAALAALSAMKHILLGVIIYFFPIPMGALVIRWTFDIIAMKIKDSSKTFSQLFAIKFKRDWPKMIMAIIGLDLLTDVLDLVGFGLIKEFLYDQLKEFIVAPIFEGILSMNPAIGDSIDRIKDAYKDSKESWQETVVDTLGPEGINNILEDSTDTDLDGDGQIEQVDLLQKLFEDNNGPVDASKYTTPEMWSGVSMANI